MGWIEKRGGRETSFSESRDKIRPSGSIYEQATYRAFEQDAHEEPWSGTLSASELTERLICSEYGKGRHLGLSGGTNFRP